MEPRSAEQARAPGRTTAMVPCSWLEMCWGLCTGQAGEPGGTSCCPRPVLSGRPQAGHPPALSLASTTSHPPAQRMHMSYVGRGCLLERSGFGGPLPSPCLGPEAQVGWHLGRFWPLETSCTPTFLWEEKQWAGQVGRCSGEQQLSHTPAGALFGLAVPGLPASALPTASPHDSHLGGRLRPPRGLLGVSR